MGRTEEYNIAALLNAIAKNRYIKSEDLVDQIVIKCSDGVLCLPDGKIITREEADKIRFEFRTSMKKNMDEFKLLEPTDLEKAERHSDQVPQKKVLYPSSKHLKGLD